MVAKKNQCHGLVKIILKNVKGMPLFGWGMRSFEFIFLDRDLSNDQITINNALDSFVDTSFPVWLLIFPEGTTINQKALDKSQEFGKKTERKTHGNILLPRTTGLQMCLKALKQAKPDIYDFTMCYDSYTGEVHTYIYIYI